MALLKVMNTIKQNVYISKQISNYKIPTQMGRWCMPNSPKYFQNATLIMDRSNEDHCGICCNNLLIKNYKTDSLADSAINDEIEKEIDKFLEEEIYYYPYTM